MSSNTPARQGPQQHPLSSLVKVEDIGKLTHVNEETRNRYRDGVQTLYQTINSQPSDSETYKNAYSKLVDVSRNIKANLQKFKASQQQQQQVLTQGNGNQQNGARPMSSGQLGQPGQPEARPQPQPAQGGGAPQQPPFSQNVIQAVQRLSIVAPPAVASKGPEVARKWVQDASAKYATHLAKIESVTARTARLQQNLKARQDKGTPFTQTEMDALRNEQARTEQLKREAQGYIAKFQQDQNEVKAQMGPSQGSQGHPSSTQASSVPNQNIDPNAGNGNPHQIKQEPQTQAHTVSSAVDAARNQANAGTRSAMSPQNNGQQVQPAINQPPNQRQLPNQMQNSHAPLNVNTNARSSDQQHNSPQVAPTQSSNMTQDPVPLSHQAAMEQARSYSQPTIPQQTPQSATHGHPPDNRPSNMHHGSQNNHPKMPISKDLNLPPTQPVSMGPSRPTLMNGPYAPGPIGQPALPKLPGYVLEGDNDRVLSKKRLEELVRQVVGGTGGEGEEGDFLTAEVEEVSFIYFSSSKTSH